MDKSTNNIYFYSEAGVRSQPEGLTFLRSFAEVELAQRSSYQIGEFLRRWEDPFGDDKYVVILMTRNSGRLIDVDQFAYDIARRSLDLNLPCYVLKRAIDQISWEMLPVKRADVRVMPSNDKRKVFQLVLDRPNSKHEIFNLVTSDKAAYTGDHIDWSDVRNKIPAQAGVIGPHDQFTPTPTLSAGVAYHYLNR